MDLPAPIKRSMLSRLLPISAVVLEDMRQTILHWAVVIWVILATLTTLVWIVTTETPTSPIKQPATEQPAVASAQPIVHTTLYRDAATTPVMPRNDSDSGTSSSSASTGTLFPGQSPEAIAKPAADAAAQKANSKTTAADFTGRLFRFHYFFWTSLIVIVGATSIAGEADYAADAILCRGVSRWQYFLGKCVARTSIVVGLFLLLTLPAVAVGALRLSNDVSVAGLYEAVKSAALVTGSIAAIAVAASIWFRNSLVASAVVWMIIYGIGIVASVLDVTMLSPAVFLEHLPTTLRGVSTAPLHQLGFYTAIAASLAVAASTVIYSRMDLS